MTVNRAAAVGRGGSLGVKALDDALEAMAFGDTGHIDLIACGEGVGL